jgi:hypothetical protein
MEKINGKGKDSFESGSRCQIHIKTNSEFTVIVNDEILGPPQSIDRSYKFILEEGDKYELLTDTKALWSYTLGYIPDNADRNNGESLLAEDEEPLTQYDILAQKYEAKFNAYAEANDLDTLEEDNDFEEEDGDYHDPLSHHEVKLMVDEHLSKKQLEADIFLKEQKDLSLKMEQEKNKNKKEETTDEE